MWGWYDRNFGACTHGSAAKYTCIWSVRTEPSLSPISLITHKHPHTHRRTRPPAALPSHTSYKNFNTRCFAKLFFTLLFFPAPHTHWGPPGKPVMPRLPLLWERKDGNWAQTYILYTAPCIYERNSWEKICVCGGPCVWYTRVPPMTTSISHSLPVQFWGLMFSHRALCSAISHTHTHNWDTIFIHLMEDLLIIAHIRSTVQV